MAYASVRSKSVVLLLLINCLMLLLLLVVHCVFLVCVMQFFWVLSSFAIILMGKREQLVVFICFTVSVLRLVGWPAACACGISIT